MAPAPDGGGPPPKQLKQLPKHLKQLPKQPLKQHRGRPAAGALVPFGAPRYTFGNLIIMQYHEYHSCDTKAKEMHARPYQANARTDWLHRKKAWVQRGLLSA